MAKLNGHIANPLYYVTGDYLLNEGHLYSYEFSAFAHHICVEMSGDPQYFFKIGLIVIPESLKFLFRFSNVAQVYSTFANIGSKFSAEQFETLERAEDSIVIQRRTPVTRDQLGETLWGVHIAAGCQTLRGALATIPRMHSNLPLAEIEERKCLLLSDDCCEWKFFWQAPKKRGWFGRG